MTRTISTFGKTAYSPGAQRLCLDSRLERRRRRWQRRAGQGKRRWFLAALRQRGPGKVWGGRTGPLGNPAGSGKGLLASLLWLAGFLAVLGLSAFLLLQTGRGSVSRVEEVSIGTAEEEGWEREFFGLRFRIQDGEILIFQEKEERKRKK